MGLWDWLERLFGRKVRVTVAGRGYRVNDLWCSTQVEVRRALEDLGLPETEILDILRRINADKYGSSTR